MSMGAMLAQDILFHLRQTGRLMTLRKVTEGSYTPVDGTVTGGSIADVSIIAALINYRSREIDGSRVLAEDRKCVIAASGVAVVPATGDRVVADGLTFTIVSPLKTYEMNGVVIAWTVQIRNVG